ncbi:MAG: peptidylprolyl isomerase [Polyangiaceae bacterium]
MIGTALFAIAPREPSRRDVSFSTEQVMAAYAAQSRRNSGRPVSADDKQEAIDALVEEELLFREGLRLGLDRDDPTLRSRVIQRALAMAIDLSGSSSPIREEDLRAHYQAHLDTWRSQPRAKISQVFVAAKEHPGEASPALSLRDRLRSNDSSGVSIAQSALASEQELASSLGKVVAAAAFAQPLGQWGEPIAGAYGWTLVRVDERVEATVPTFEQARHEVFADLVRLRTVDARAKLLERLAHEYRVRVDVPEGDHVSPSFKPTTHLDVTESNARSSKPGAP